MLHAKALLVDHSLGIIGSANADLRSLLLDYEVSVLLYSSPDIATLEAWFSDLMVDCAPGLRRAAPSRRAVEAVGRLIAPLV
jgi:cardiolipin synthase